MTRRWHDSRRGAPVVGALLMAAAMATALPVSAEGQTVESSSADQPTCQRNAGCGRSGRSAKPRRQAKAKRQEKQQPHDTAADPGGSQNPQTPAPNAKDTGNPDPFRELGAGSPLCREPGVSSRPGCRLSGSVAHTFPVSNYGLDIQIETRIDKVESNLFVALQSVASLVWLGLVYALMGVLLLVEWAFSLDLLNRSLSSATRAIDRLHETVFGTPWFMAAIAVAGLWGIWRGLVQMETLRTIVGLAATVGLMLVALVLINDPRGTVGHGSQLANDASLGVLSAASTGHTADPKGALATAQHRLFDQLVIGPWCALQFGSVKWCTRKGPRGVSQADLWLSFPAGGKQRKALYALTKDKDPPNSGGGLLDTLKNAGEGLSKYGPAGIGLSLNPLGGGGGSGDATVLKTFRDAVPVAPERVQMQEQDGTFTRIALLALVAVGLAGAICLLLYLAIKLVLAGVMALLLILLSPAMLLAPAFGEAGREAFITWAKRLLGAIAAKLIFSLLLAIVIVAATTLASLPIGWFGVWLLQAAFWWGILIKRHELLGFLSAGSHGDDQGRNGSSIWQAHRNARAVGSIATTATAAATLLPRRGGQARVASKLGRQEADRRAVSGGASTALDREAEHSHGVELAGARRTVAHRPDLERTASALDRELSPYERNLARFTSEGRRPRPPTEQERAMLAQRDRVQRLLGSDEMRTADHTVREADRSRAREGSEAGRAERGAWRERRRLELATDRPPEHETHLRAAGIDPRDYQRADPARKLELRRTSQDAIDRHRSLLDAAPTQDSGQPTPHQVTAAKRYLDAGELASTSKSELARVRHEHKVRKRRAHLHRRR